MEKAIAKALSAWLPITHVALVDGPGLVPGLRVTPAVTIDDDIRPALTEVVALAHRHLEVITRVAALSRKAHREHRPQLIAQSAVMRDVLERARRVARHDTTVLITGESGTGKEVLAQEIHRASGRRPFVAVDCASLALVESELFGHERGAFTGAVRSRPGAFERAHGGTLLLDEIGELPIDAQAKLLRVLQERKVQRIGGDVIAVDVRVIAATNRSLEAMVHAGAFREDLYYRLAVFTIELPPLRARRDDIAPLARAFGAGAIADELAALDWPGNVRQLVNAIETWRVTGELPKSRADHTFAGSSRSTIAAALRATRGKIYGTDGAAARLGLKPATLQSKMKRLGLDRSAFV